MVQLLVTSGKAGMTDIEPGCPWENGFVESFHDKFWRECLAREHFYTLSEARVVIAAWKKKYNELGPRRSLEMKTPEEFANGWNSGERWRAQQASCVSRLRPSLRKPVGDGSGKAIERHQSSYSKWAIKWKGGRRKLSWLCAQFPECG